MTMGEQGGDVRDLDGQAMALGRLVAAHRARHGRSARIPSELKRRVVQAWMAGVTERALRRACGLSEGQLYRWRGKMMVRPARAAQGNQDVATGARVLPVVAAEQAEPGAEQGPLTVTLGPWKVSISRSPG